MSKSLVKEKGKCIVCGVKLISVPITTIYCGKQYKCTAKATWKKRNWGYVLVNNRKYLKKRRESDPERERTRVRVWQKANPEWVKQAARDYKRLRKSRIRAGGGRVSRKEWEDIKISQNQLCNICKLPKPLTMDHIHPISKGGAHYKENIQALCMECNRLKGNKIS